MVETSERNFTRNDMWNRNLVKRIDIEITSFCNIECSACTRVGSKDKLDKILNNEILSYALLKEKVRPKDFPNLEIINLCGSVDEPMSHPEIDDIIDHFSQWRDIHLSISTNGSIRSTKWWAELGAKSKKTGRIGILWGVDGIDEVSEIYRNGSNFQKVRENWRAYNNAGGRSTWQFIVFEHNKHQLPMLEEVAKQEGFARTKVIYSDRPSTTNVVKVIRKNKEAASLKPSAPLTIDPVVIEKEELPSIQCRYLSNGYLFINHLGDVIPCCYFNPTHLIAHNDRRLNESGSKYIDNWKDFGGQLATNLKYNEIVDVIEGEWFTDMALSWRIDPHQLCLSKCKENKLHTMIHKDLPKE